MFKNNTRIQWAGALVFLGGLLLVSYASNLRLSQAKPVKPVTEDRLHASRISWKDHDNHALRLSLSPTADLAVVGQFRNLCWVNSFSNPACAFKSLQEMDCLEDCVQVAFSGDGRRLVVIGERNSRASVGLVDAKSRTILGSYPIIRSLSRPTLRVSHRGDYVALRTTEHGVDDEERDAISIRDVQTLQVTGSVVVPESAIVTDMCVTNGHLNYAYNLGPDYAEMQIHSMKLVGNEPVHRCSIRATGAARFETARFSPDGTRLVVSQLFGEPLKIYDSCSGELVAELPNSTFFTSDRHFCGYAISNDNRLLATASASGIVTVWRLTDRIANKLSEMVDTLDMRCSYLAFGHDDQSLFAIVDKSVYVWDIHGRVVKAKYNRPED